MTIAVLLVLALLGPLLAIGIERLPKMEWLNPVLSCYAIGIFFALTLADPSSLAVAETVRDASIPLAIPLLLFGTDIRGLRRVSGGMLLAFVFAVVGVTIAATAGRFLFADVEGSSAIAGMLVGVYTGGTPNMAAVGQALEVPEEVFVLLNASDVALGAIYLMVLLTVAKPVLGRLFPGFEASEVEVVAHEEEARIRLIDVVLGLFLAVVILAISAGATWLAVGELHVAGVILGITTGGLLASLVARVRSLEGTFEAGNYLILVFCVAIGAQTDLVALMEASSEVFGFAVTVMAGAILIHLVLCRLGRLDVDTTLLSSTAAVYGPPFVPLVARAIGNRQLVAPALCAGVLGYVVGNYLGIGLAWVL